MTRIVRNRSRPVSNSGFRQFTLNGAVSSTTPGSITRTCACTDYIGRPVVDSAFNSNQYQVGLVVNGSATGKILAGQVNGVVYNNYPITPVTSGVNSTPLAVPNGWFLDTVARSNPSRPVLTPLTLIQDVVELPAMVRDVGRLLNSPTKGLSAKQLANRNLAVQFGWLPLIKDLKQLLDLQRIILQRMRELRKLQSGPGLRRRLTINEDTQTASQTVTQTLDIAASVTYSYDIIVKKKMWSTIHWKATAIPMSAPNDEELYRLARRLVLGLTPEGLARGTWEVLPWTWLIGWFSNVGNYMLQYSNTVPASHTSACLMNETKVYCVGGMVSSRNTTNCGVTVSGTYSQTTKTRGVSGGLTPGFNLPFVGLFRLSILGSLYVQRFAR
jgi:hypothetical protein